MSWKVSCNSSSSNNLAISPVGGLTHRAAAMEFSSFGIPFISMQKLAVKACQAERKKKSETFTLCRLL